MDDRRKRLLYRANHRGMKETDALVGGYASLHLAPMTEVEVDEFERILDESDNDLMNWILEREPVPGRVDGHVMQKIIKYKRSM